MSKEAVTFHVQHVLGEMKKHLADSMGGIRLRVYSLMLVVLFAQSLRSLYTFRLRFYNFGRVITDEKCALRFIFISTLNSAHGGLLHS